MQIVFYDWFLLFAVLQARQTAIIFSYRETNHENVSPLLFGDFNDDILQLMKQEENHIDNVISNGPSSISDSSVAQNASESADYSAITDCNQSKPNIHTPMMSSQSDPGYTSAHRTTAPTESHEVMHMTSQKWASKINYFPICIVSGGWC